MKNIFLIILLSGLSACSMQDEYYFSLHPVALQQALKACPLHPPKKVTCIELQALAVEMDKLSYQLRLDPQAYGKVILSLQETMAKQVQSLQQNANQPELKKVFDKNKRELKIRLAIVKWLESPES